MVKIALVEDDENLAATIVEYLTLHNYRVKHYTSGLEFIDSVKLSEINFIILDLFIRDMNGLDVLEYLKSIESKVPIFILSGALDIEFIEKAFYLGVKDYVKKPVHLKELLLRIERFLDVDSDIVLSDELKFVKSKNLLLKSNKEVYLTPKQKELLTLFLQYPNETLTYDFLMASVWDSSDIATNTIATYIRDLKAIINPVKIVNVSKVGYKLVL